jgi:4-diphosphocytidyl-2-C-methyl-D-erythritol kinase
MPESKMNRETANQSISFSAPAKINLFLAVTGKRSDGFHDLISLLAKIDLCDLVTLEKTDRVGEISCKCLGNEELSGDGNLAWKAVELWRETTGEKDGVRVTIQKRIPVMAGLGGGSSDAVATLRGLNSWRGNPLKQEELMKIASRLGSDCASFLIEGACVASGRGETVRPLSEKANAKLEGKRLLLFKPSLGFSTEGIYRAMSERQEVFSSEQDADRRIQAWKNDKIDLGDCLGNDLERPAFDKYYFIRPLFETLNERFDLRPLLSGSGSCCFAILGDGCPVERVVQYVKEAWGEETFVAEHRIRS